MRTLMGQMGRGARIVNVLVVAAALLLPQAGWAGSHTVLGSLNVTNANGSPLTTGDVVGLALIANPGMEKSISPQLPPYTVPVFIDVDTDSGDHVVNSRFDTTVLLTNTTGSPLPVLLTVRDAGGTTLGSKTLTIAAHGTVAVVLSSLL
jgi:hypothetical protein